MPHFFLILFVFFAGCGQKPQVRHYTEINIENPQTPGESVGNAGKIAWDVPAGWSQQQGGAMRLATLRLIDRPAAFDCSIVSLPGQAGGLEANLKRWMGQIGLEVSDGQMQQFISSSPNQVYDFSRLQKDKGPGTESMIAAVLEVDGASVFVKLKASIAEVQKNKDAFLSLVKSVHSK